MLLTRLLHRKKTDEPRPERTRWVMFLVIAILGSTVVLKLIDTTVAPARSLLASAPGLVHLSTFDQLADTSVMTITSPTNTFGAELFTIGVYTEINDVFPTDTVSLIYVRDDWRFVEIDYLPNRSLQDQLAMFSLYPREEVILNETTSAALLTRDESPRCIDYDDDLPNKCEITNQLLFEYGGLLISISTDGDHVTVGEMIEIAKSILTKNTNQ